MCCLCDTIYKSNIELSNDKYESYDKGVYIESGIVNTDNCFNIVIPDQDGDRSVTDIKYCPYCGKELLGC